MELEDRVAVLERLLTLHILATLGWDESGWFQEGPNT
jgi:hypothetical protein